jgi:hypothetical protein
MRPEVRLFISNPDTETVSYRGYKATLEALAANGGVDREAFRRSVFGPTAVRGRLIHHREAPEAVAAGRADAAVVYYHLALRFTRLFPEQFDFIPLGGTRTKPSPLPGNAVQSFDIGIVGDGGRWGAACAEFMQGPTVAEIYAGHGLIHNRGRGF